MERGIVAKWKDYILPTIIKMQAMNKNFTVANQRPVEGQFSLWEGCPILSSLKLDITE